NCFRGRRAGYWFPWFPAWSRLVVSLLAGRTRRRALLRRATKTGFQHGLWHLDAGCGLAAASGAASEISVWRFLSRLGARRRVGTHQDPESLWREHLPGRRQWNRR